MISSFHLFYPFFSWIFQNENVLYLLFSLKPLFYAGLSGDAGYSVFNRIFRSEKVFACAAVYGQQKNTRVRGIFQLVA